MIYKLTNQDHQTRGRTQWGENVTHRAAGEKGQDLCSSGFIHAYEHPDLAILFNPLHANVNNPVVWEARGKVYKSDGLKIGCRQLTTLKIIPLPKWEATQRAAFAILCAQEVYDDAGFRKWAVNWLSGDDRSAGAAAGAAEAAEAAAGAAWAAGAAGAAAWAAEAAAWAAGAAEAIDFIALLEKAKKIR